MKLLNLLTLIFFASPLFAQHGGVSLTLSDPYLNCRYADMDLRISRDTTFADTFHTNDAGEVMALQLPVGKVNCELLEFGKPIANFTLDIQLYQLYSANVYVRRNAATRIDNGSAPQYIPGEGSPDKITITREDLRLMPVQSISAMSITESLSTKDMQLEEVVIAYRQPLITNYDMGVNTTYSRSRDGSYMINSQWSLTEGRVGGMTQNGADTYVRGSRGDASATYIDGVKTRGNASIPHSAVESVTVITSGIPANYGDVTGGVVSIQTKSYASVQADRRSRASKGAASGRSPRRERIVETEPEPYTWNSRDAFLPIYENIELSPADAPHSTFGLDVDRASWRYIQSQLDHQLTVARDAVKLEELINSFDYGQPEVPAGKDLNVQFRRMDCPWNEHHELVAVQLRAKDLPKTERRPHNIVFLVDVSGSMTAENKLPLLKEGLRSFVATLLPEDRVSLVTYAGNAGVVLLPTACDAKETIYAAIDNLTSGGSTNGIGGIQAAYQLAAESYLPNGNNRIILATDGDFNVGISNTQELEAYISLQRGKGIYLTALGFGMGNYRNDILETLADRGDGNHFYIRSREDCQEVLEHNLGNLFNLARDVKLNVEFNPELVAHYRLIGYENRLMPSSHFRDDTKDGGEIGYGHQVVAVYEIEPGKAVESVDAHFTKTKSVRGTGDELCKVSLRYKLLEAASSVEEHFLLKADAERTNDPLLQTVIAFGLELRQSAYKGTCGRALLAQQVAALGKTKQELELKSAIETYLLATGR